MDEVDYGKYMVKKPLRKESLGVRNIKELTYMSDELVPGVNNHVTLNWIYGIPEPNPCVYEHVHDYDQIIIFWSNDPDEPQVLGGEIEFYIGGQAVTFTTTTGIYIPRGLRHGPVIWKKFTRPHVQTVITVGTGSTEEVYEKSGLREPKDDLPRKTDKIDYERYVVRSPFYEDAPRVKNRQAPTMTYMSRPHIPEANYYFEFGWLYGMPEPNPHIFEHLHHFDEIVFHLGGDPADPEDLGGKIEICVAGQPILMDASCVFFLPKGIKHGPNTWKEFRKPHIEGAIMLGAGTFAEGWGANIDHLQRPEEK